MWLIWRKMRRRHIRITTQWAPNAHWLLIRVWLWMDTGPTSPLAAMRNVAERKKRVIIKDQTPLRLTTTMVATRRFLACENQMAKCRSQSRCNQSQSVNDGSAKRLRVKSKRQRSTFKLPASQVQTHTTADESPTRKLNGPLPPYPSSSLDHRRRLEYKLRKSKANARSTNLKEMLSDAIAMTAQSGRHRLHNTRTQVRFRPRQALFSCIVVIMCPPIV